MCVGVRVCTTVCYVCVHACGCVCVQQIFIKFDWRSNCICHIQICSSVALQGHGRRRQIKRTERSSARGIVDTGLQWVQEELVVWPAVYGLTLNLLLSSYFVALVAVA